MSRVSEWESARVQVFKVFNNISTLEFLVPNFLTHPYPPTKFSKKMRNSKAKNQKIIQEKNHLFWSYFSFWPLSFSQSWNILKIRRWLELLKKDHRNGISIVLFDLMSRGGHNLEFIFRHYLRFKILVAKKCRHKISLFWHGIRKALFFWHDLKTDTLFLTWHRHEHRHVDKSH